jgi:flagellar basal body rod protein FlgC
MTAGIDSFGLLGTAASAMDAQRAALDVAARNVAAAEAAGPDGNYARMIPEFGLVDGDDGETRVQFTGSRVEAGTNVDMLTEMIAVMNASRAYESDASLFDVGKSLAEKTIELGRL